MNIKLYSTGCPRCKVLQKKLENADIDYELITDFDTGVLLTLGFETVPVLQVDTNYLDFSKAVNWINNR